MVLVTSPAGWAFSSEDAGSLPFDDLEKRPFLGFFSCSCGELSCSTASPFSFTWTSEWLEDAGAMACDGDLQRVNLMVVVDDQGRKRRNN